MSVRGEPATAGVVVSPLDGRELGARGRRTRQRLMRAGATVFQRKGYHQARVDDIVRAARTSHGTFYSYFSNKEDLFRALTEDVVRDLAALADSLGPLRAGPEGRAELRRWVEGLSALYGSYSTVIQVWTEAETKSSPFGQMGVEVLSSLSAALAGRMGAVAGLDHRIAALALVAMVERANYYVLSRQLDVERDAVVDTLAAVAYAALFGAASDG